MNHLRNDRNGQSVFESVLIFISLVICLMVLVPVLSNLWPAFTNNLKNYSANETIFVPTVKKLTPLLIGVAVLLAILALVFGIRLFQEEFGG